MVKLNPDELRKISEEIDGIVNGQRDLLHHNPKIRRPLIEARDAARAKYETVSEHQKPENQPANQSRLSRSDNDSAAILYLP